MKFGLEGISRLLKHLSDPHKKFDSIHVAGTNGKGSTASMLAAMCSSAGYKTGLYTSPHLMRFEERIRINGKPIPRRAVAQITSRMHPLLLRKSPTFFEATTALAFRYFADEAVDIAIVETGLGGRLDSTNVLTPIASVVTNVGLEHVEILGGTLRKIAQEKAGIIKRRRPCITGVRDKEALSVIKRIAGLMRAPLTVATDCTIKVRSASISGSSVDFKSARCAYKNLDLSLAGPFQFDNLAVALATASVVNDEGSLPLSEKAIRAGLSRIQELSGLSGRLAVIHERPRVIADVAHNPDATRRLAEALKRLRIKTPVVVFGVLRDKEYLAMVQDIAGIAGNVVAVAPRSERARPASDIAAAFEREGCNVRAALSVDEGIGLACEIAGSSGVILLTGSHLVVGEGMAVFGRKRA